MLADRSRPSPEKPLVERIREFLPILARFEEPTDPQLPISAVEIMKNFITLKPQGSPGAEAFRQVMQGFKDVADGKTLTPLQIIAFEAFSTGLDYIKKDIFGESINAQTHAEEIKNISGFKRHKISNQIEALEHRYFPLVPTTYSDRELNYPNNAAAIFEDIAKRLHKAANLIDQFHSQYQEIIGSYFSSPQNKKSR